MDAHQRGPSTARQAAGIRLREGTEPAWKSVEVIQRGRMMLDVALADLAAAESTLGPFHPTTGFFRESRDEYRRAWDRLRAVHGSAVLEAALDEPPAAVLRLGDPDAPRAILILIGGKTYFAEALPGNDLAPILWRLTRLPAQQDGPYYLCRLREGTTQCDCAEWTYQVADVPEAPPCKHLAALAALGWI